MDKGPTKAQLIERLDELERRWLPMGVGAVDVPRVLADLRRLLDVDGLDGVPLLATTAVEPEGMTGLREALEPFALMSSEGVVKEASGYVTITTCAEYFHRAKAALGGLNG